VYVQNLIEKNALEVFDAVYNRNGHFYICGDVGMAADVTKTLENVLVTQKNMSKLHAKSYVNEMKENLRFHEDIFGSNLTTTKIEE
jgi:nitric-oxide synthase